MTAQEAKEKGCRTLEGNAITVIQSPRPRTAAPASGPRPPEAKVDAAEQRSRDSDARRILEAELRRDEAQLAAMRKEYNNGEPERQGNERNFQRYLDRVAEMKSRHRAQGKRRRRPQARARQAAAVSRDGADRTRVPVASAAASVALHASATGTADGPAQPYAALDHLATMVAVVQPDGRCVFVNAAFESVLGLSRRSVLRGSLFDWFVDARVVSDTVAAVARNDFATSRFEGLLRRPGHGEALPVHVIVNQMDRGAAVVVELVEIEQQTRQDREERALDQVQATKELIRNLAHEIKNPARRHPRRCAVARHGGRGQGADRVHAGDHPRGGSPAGPGRPPARATPQAARGGRRQHPRSLRTRALVDRGRVSPGSAGASATTTPRSRSSAATASS